MFEGIFKQSENKIDQATNKKSALTDDIKESIISVKIYHNYILE
jgi:hypothetical protein